MTRKIEKIAPLAAAAALTMMAGTAFGQFAGFGPSAFYNGGSLPWSITAGDVNADGNDDLIVMNFFADVGLLLSNGDGTFAGVQVLPTGSSSARSDPRVADVDGDGHPDILAATRDGVAIFFGNGDGTFEAAAFVNSEWTEAVAAGDLNGDGLLDVVLTADVIQLDPGNSENEVVIYLNDGGRSFVAQTPITDVLAGFSDVALGDLNGDGKLDLVTGNPYSRDLSVFRGNGDGSFGSPDYLFTSANAVRVVLADLDGDGHLDIANTNGNGVSTVDIFFNNGNGTFGFPFGFEAGAANAILAVGDVNNDGLNDLLTSGPGQSGVVVAISNGDRTFQAGQLFAFPGSSVNGTLGDFDGDGDLDFAAANIGTTGVDVLLNETIVVTEPECPADFDGNGTADVNDLLGFLGAFRVQGAGSDFDGNGSVDVNDLLGFLGAFRNGCPD